MRQLLRDAEQVLETALSAASAGPHSTAICITSAGQINIVAAPSGWTLAALAAYYGADSAFLVEQRAADVRVQAWSHGATCVLLRELAPKPLRQREEPSQSRLAERTLPIRAELVRVCDYGRAPVDPPRHAPLHRYSEFADIPPRMPVTAVSS